MHVLSSLTRRRSCLQTSVISGRRKPRSPLSCSAKRYVFNNGFLCILCASPSYLLLWKKKPTRSELCIVSFCFSPLYFFLLQLLVTYIYTHVNRSRSSCVAWPRSISAKIAARTHSICARIKPLRSSWRTTTKSTRQIRRLASKVCTHLCVRVSVCGEGSCARACVHACVRACECTCMRACVCACSCVHAFMRVCVCACACVHSVSWLSILIFWCFTVAVLGDDIKKKNKKQKNDDGDSKKNKSDKKKKKKHSSSDEEEPKEANSNSEVRKQNFFKYKINKKRVRNRKEVKKRRRKKLE